jgi:hypothetical protein
MPQPSPGRRIDSDREPTTHPDGRAPDPHQRTEERHNRDSCGEPASKGEKLDGFGIVDCCAGAGQVATPGRRAAPAAAVAAPARYGGFTEATTPRHLVLPATSSVLLVVKLADSPYRPPAFVLGAHDSFMVLEGACARSYLEVWLAPLGAYRLLGRLEVGPRPSPEVGRAWERLVASAGTVPIGQIASEVGWSHKHLIARFRQQVGVRPKTAARTVPRAGDGGGEANSVQDMVAASS